MKDKSAAVLTIKDAQKMTPKDRREIAAWLQMHAKYLVEHGREYSPRFTGRYLAKGFYGACPHATS